MFKDILKLSRKLLILTILSGALFFTLGIKANSAAAGATTCCSDCELDKALCMSYCQIHPGTPLCHDCTNDYHTCFLTCDPGC